MPNFGTPENPTYAATYNSANTDIDLFGLDPYPIRPQFDNGVDYNVIPAAVAAAETEGIPLAQIVPVYQAFGGGGIRVIHFQLRLRNSRFCPPGRD